MPKNLLHCETGFGVYRSVHLELGCVYVGAVIDDKSRDTSEAERMIVIGLY
jgi:hypothetical protein